MPARMRDRFERGEDLEQPRLLARAPAEVAVDRIGERGLVFLQQPGERFQRGANWDTHPPKVRNYVRALSRLQATAVAGDGVRLKRTDATVELTLKGGKKLVFELERQANESYRVKSSARSDVLVVPQALGRVLAADGRDRGQTRALVRGDQQVSESVQLRAQLIEIAAGRDQRAVTNLGQRLSPLDDSTELQQTRIATAVQVPPEIGQRQPDYGRPRHSHLVPPPSASCWAYPPIGPNSGRRRCGSFAHSGD